MANLFLRKLFRAAGYLTRLFILLILARTFLFGRRFRTTLQNVPVEGNQPSPPASFDKVTAQNNSPPGVSSQPQKLPSREIVMNSNEISTAVVVTTRYLNDCLAERLRHLVETAGSGERMGQRRRRDVVVLHNHASLPANGTQLIQSQKWIQSIPGLKSAQQARERLKKFDTAISGSSKSSFLRFVVDNNYSYAWHLEDDSFYTGRWEEVFDDEIHSDDSFDVVTLMRPEVSTWNWYNHPRIPCSIAISTEGKKEKKNCKSIEMIAVLWSVIRISLPFARSLLADLETGSVTGHHEAVVAPYSKARNFRMQQLNRVGFIENGNWGIWKEAKRHRLRRLNPVPHRLYHPVKCAAHSKEGDRQYLREHLIYRKAG